MRETSPRMTTTTTTIGQGMSTTTPPKNGSDDASADAKAKVLLEAKKEKKRLKRKQKRKDKKNNSNGNNNSNNVKFEGLQTEGIMKDITISTGDSASMTVKFQTYKKRTSVYAASKGYEHWPSVITNMKPVDDADWKVKRPNKSLYATKRITKIENEDKTFIMKQEWVVTDCEKQDELEDNHTDIQRQKTTEHALYCKNGAALFIVMYGQLHPKIITIAKQSTSPDFTTVQQEQDVVGLLSILQSICVKNLTSSRVDPYSEHLKIQASTLSYVQTKDVSNDNFGDAILDQVTAAQSQCGNFVFGEQ